jgi:quercetin dioxygenase-like cupin family protein
MKIIQAKTSRGAAEQFTGNVYPTIVARGEEPSRVRMGSVHFSPGSRTAWHSHAVGQYLYVIEGTAYVQERGEEKRVLKPGEVIYTAPGVEHWHGASPESFMVHIAVWEAPEPHINEPESTWKEHVTDEQYNSAPKSNSAI